MKPTKTYPFLLSIVLLTSGCSQVPNEHSFDPDLFDTRGRSVLVLCFDLRNDNHPIAGVVVSGFARQTSPTPAVPQLEQPTPTPTKPSLSTAKGTPTPTPSPTPTPTPESPRVHTLILPFDVATVDKNRKILTTWASYRDFTIVNYIPPLKSDDVQAFGIVPHFGEQPDKVLQIEDLKESVYLLRSGLVRRFIYKYTTSTATLPTWPLEIQKLPRDLMDGIGVAVPADAEGVEIRQNMTAIPGYEFDNGRAKFYAAYATEAAPKYLEVRYAVQPSKPLKIFGEAAPKVLLAIFVPLLELAFLGKKDVQKRKTRLLLIFGGITVQVIILGFLVWSALKIRGEFQENTIVELISIFVGAISTALVLYVKKKP